MTSKGPRRSPLFHAGDNKPKLALKVQYAEADLLPVGDKSHDVPLDRRQGVADQMPGRQRREVVFQAPHHLIVQCVVIRVGVGNREKFFDRRWQEIEVEIDSQIHRFRLTPGFWRKCPEFHDHGTPVIRDWLRRHPMLDWPKGQSPEVELVPLGGGRFRLLA